MCKKVQIENFDQVVGFPNGTAHIANVDDSIVKTQPIVVLVIKPTKVEFTKYDKIFCKQVSNLAKLIRMSCCRFFYILVSPARHTGT